MRYEDASLSGSFQDRGPIARDDADNLAAGDRGPATGNVITGAGTETGTSGADSAAGARVTALAGAGGTDTSFTSGQLRVEGEHGTLSLTARGDYSYTAKAGVPENSRDVFTYTLADSSGQTSQARLMIEIGKTQAVVDANAQRVVPGPDGVVVLPAGVELSDIRIVGRDLLILLPDGTQMLIVDGAVFVPQLVINDIEVPSTNLAALLIEQEPRPASGVPQSSGGNFVQPVGPLDPGVPLGDLIPPTELQYQPPEFRDAFVDEDNEPTVGLNPTILFDDDVRAGGNPGGTGDDADGANLSGTLSGAGGDGPLTFTVSTAGAPAGFTYVAGPNGAVLVQQGGVTVLTVTVNPQTGAYTVVQNAPILHAAGDNENNVVFNFTYTVTDNDGDQASGTFQINVDDDTPVVDVTAGADANVTLTTDDVDTRGALTDAVSSSAAFGGVFGVSQSIGADGLGSSTGLSYALGTPGGASGLTQGGVAINLYLVGGKVVGSTATSAAGVTAANTVFDVSVSGTGVVTLTQYSQIDHTNTDPSPTGSPFSDQIISLADGAVTLTASASMTDRDSDTASDSATVQIGANLRFTDDGPSLGEVRVGAGVTLDETNAVPGGFPISATSASAVIAGSAFNFGADGPAASGSVSYGLTVVGNGTTPLRTAQGDFPITLVQTSAGVITGTYNDGTGVKTAFTVTINTNGTVTVQQLVPLEHNVDGSTAAAYDDSLNLAGLVNATITARDSDGDTATGSAPIGDLIVFKDDGPNAGLSDSGAPVLILDETRAVGTDTPGGTAPAGLDTVSVNVAGNFIAAAYGADGAGSTSYALVLTGTNVASGLYALGAGGAPGAQIVLNQSGSTIAGTAGGVTYFTITISGSTVTFTQLQPIWHGNTASFDEEALLNLASGTLVVRQTVTDADGDFDTADLDLSGGVFRIQDDGPDAQVVAGATANAVVLDESEPQGSDTAGGGAPGGLNSGSVSFAANFGTTVDYGSDGAGGVAYKLTVTPAASGASVGSGLFALDPSDTSVTAGDGYGQGAEIQLVQVDATTVAGRIGGTTYFTLTIDQSGSVTFTQLLPIWHPTAGASYDEAAALIASGGSLLVQQTVTDRDGDSETADLNVGNGVFAIQDDGPILLAGSGGTQVDEDELPGGITDGDGVGVSNTGTLAALVDFGEDGAGSFRFSLGSPTGLPALTSGGQTVNYAVSADGLTLIGYTGSDPAAGQVFTATLTNPVTGAYTFTLIKPVAHATATVAPAGDNETLSLNLSSAVVATDADGDTVRLENGFVVTIEDDIPTASIGSSTQNPQPVLTTQDAETDGIPTDTDTAVTTIDFGNSITFGGAAGADGLASAVKNYSLSVENSASGMTSGGQPIFLYRLADGTVVGSTSSSPVTAIDGTAVFSLAVSATGVVTLSQYKAVDHDLPGEADGPYDDQLEVLLDDKINLDVTYTVTDGDGDKAVATTQIDLGGNIRFADDGPTAVGENLGTIGENQSVTFNPFANGDSYGADGPAATGPLTFTQPAQGTVTYTNGQFTFTPVPGQTGQVTFTYTLTDADGDTDTATVTLTMAQDSKPTIAVNDLTVDEKGLPARVGEPNSEGTGEAANALPDTDNSEIASGQMTIGTGGDTLAKVEVRNAAGLWIDVTAGTQASPVLVQGNDGVLAVYKDGSGNYVYTYTLTDNLENHPDNDLSPDGDRGAADPLPGDSFQVRVTDSDGSVSTPDANSTINITVLDDGPVLSAATLGAVEVIDETTARAGFPIVAVTDNAVISASATYGADGPAASGALVYKLVVPGAATSILTTLRTADGDQQITIRETADPTLLEGVYGGNNIAFTLKIDPATGVVTYTQNVALEHATDGSDAVALNDTNTPLTLAGFVSAVLTIKDGDGDLATTGEIDIGGQFRIFDDGPALNIVQDSGSVVEGQTFNGTWTRIESADGTESVVVTFGATSQTLSLTPGSTVSIVQSTGTLVVRADGTYSFTAAGNQDNDAVPPPSASFTIRINDKDGDFAQDSVTIGITDGPPAGNAAPITLTVDERALDTAGAVGSNPASPDEQDSSPALQFTAGSDALTSFQFSNNSLTTLVANLDGAGTDLYWRFADASQTTIIGSLTQNGPAAVTIAITSAPPINAGQVGSVTVTVTLADNLPSALVQGITTDALGYVTVEARTQDGDVATGRVNVQVIDDTPDVTVTKSDTAEAAIQLITQDAETDGNPKDTDTDSTSFAGAFGLTFVAGADGAATPTLSYSLGITASDNVARTSGGAPITSGGQTVYLYKVGNNVVGSTSSDPNLISDANKVFELSVVATGANAGTVTLSQYKALDHTGANPSTLSLADTLVTLTASATITDGDQDTDSDSKTIFIGSNLVFQDDVPAITATLTGTQLRIDETDGVVAAGGETDDVGGNLGTVTLTAAQLYTVTTVASSADQPETTTYTLIDPNGADSGLDYSPTNESIFLYRLNDTTVEGRVGSAAGAVAFSITVQPDGTTTLTQFLAVEHGNTSSNDEDSAALAANSLRVQVTRTDYDGDTNSPAAIVDLGSIIRFEDDGPRITAASNININNGGDYAHTGQFAFTVGSDSPNPSNDDIKNLTMSVAIGTQTINVTPTAGVENATTATYTFSFQYAVTATTNATATGTITFNKAAGTYTVDLDQAIQPFTTINSTSGATTFLGYDVGTTTPTNSQPDVVNVQLRADNASTPANEALWVRLTGLAGSPGTTDGNNTLTAGEFITGGQSWVSASNTANGVAGDIVNQDQVLNLELFTTNQFGDPDNLATASASAIYLKLDNIGQQEDFVVNLKLWNDANGNGTVEQNEVTTRAVYVANGDIIKGKEFDSGPGQYSGVKLDNNDGLVIIESNDYNFGNENYQIIGAQIATTDQGLNGAAINLNGAIGAGGASTTGANISNDSNDLGFKIQDIGFVSTTSAAQSATITLGVTVGDADGDTVSQTLTATVSAAADSSTPIALAPAVSQPTSTSNTLRTMDTSSLTYAGLAAAVGMTSVPLAAEPTETGVDQIGSIDDYQVSNSPTSISSRSLPVENQLLQVEEDSGSFQAAVMPTSGPGQHFAGNDRVAFNDNASDSDEAVTANLDSGTELPAAAQPYAVPFAGGEIHLPSGDQLVEAFGQAHSAVQGNAIVEEVLLDALSGGSDGPNLDKLIEAAAKLAGEQGGENVGPATPGGLASGLPDHVPGWDGGHFGALFHAPIAVMETSALHPDAVQPAQNG